MLVVACTDGLHVTLPEEFSQRIISEPRP